MDLNAYPIPIWLATGMNKQSITVNLATAAEHYANTLELISSATRTIYILCHDLSPRIYNHPDVASALSTFITGNSANRSVQILVSDINSIISVDHKILNICRRLSSNIRIQKLAKQHAHNTESFILIDNKKYINRTDYTQFNGRLGYDQKQAKVMLNSFNEYWNCSEVDSNLNRLYI